MKRIILFLLVFASLAASKPPEKGGCNQPITRNTTCPNEAVQGSNFCAEHQRTAESRKGKGVDASFAMCVIVDNTVPCKFTAIPGKTYCYFHEVHAGPSPTMRYCIVPVRVGNSYVPCIKPPINISGKCADHFVPTPPPPPPPF